MVLASCSIKVCDEKTICNHDLHFLLTRGYLQTILLLNNITMTFRGGEGSGPCDVIASLFYMQTSLEQLNTMACYYLRGMSEDINDFIDVGM